MPTSIEFKGFEPPIPKSGYEVTINKKEDFSGCKLDIILTDHSIPLGMGNALRIASISIPKSEPYEKINVELISTYAKTTSYFNESSPEEEPSYRTFTLIKNTSK